MCAALAFCGAGCTAAAPGGSAAVPDSSAEQSTAPDAAVDAAGSDQGWQTAPAEGEPIAYVAAVSLAGALTPAEDAPPGTRWQVERADDVTVYIGSLYVGFDTISLSACAGEPGAGLAESAPARLWRWLDPRPRAAWAAHPVSSDPSQLDVGVGEVLHEARAAALGAAPAGGAAYCRVHVLHSPLGVDAQDGFALGGRSLALRGWLRRSAGGPLEPLDGDVLIRGGALIDLSPATTQDEARAAAALTEAARTAGSRQGDGVHDAQTTVVLTRYPAEALATVALLDRDPIDVAFDLLLAIGETSRAVAMPR